MKKLLFALPVILLVAAGCNSTQQSYTPQNTTSTSSQDQAQTQTIPDNSTGLKLYTSSAFGYTINYPETWSIDTQRSSTNEVVFNNGISGSHVSITVKPYSKTVTDWKNSLDQNAIVKTESFTIDGQTGTEFYSGEMGGGSGQAGIVYKGNLYIFGEVNSMPTAMLNSFKFESSNTNPSNSLGISSKLYTNAKYGYQFQYPNSGLNETINEKTISNKNSEPINENIVEFGYGPKGHTYQIITTIGALKSGTLESWISDAMAIDNNINNYSKITLGGHIAYLNKNSSVALVNNGGNVYKIEVLQEGKNSVLLTAPADNDPAFNLILSTFTFVK